MSEINTVYYYFINKHTIYKPNALKHVTKVEINNEDLVSSFVYIWLCNLELILKYILYLTFYRKRNIQTWKLT